MEASTTAKSSDLAIESSALLNLRQYARNTLGWVRNYDENINSELEQVLSAAQGLRTLQLQKPLSSREKHEAALWVALQDAPDAEMAYNKLNQAFRTRAMKGYLFDCEKNQKIVSATDPWLEDVWVWIQGS